MKKFLLASLLSAPLLLAQYPVGVMTTTVVDASRTDHLTNGPRTMLTEIWYPADDKARSMPPGKYSDFFPGGITPEADAQVKGQFHMSAAELDAIFKTTAVRDAPLRKGRFPLVIFSHGNGGGRTQNTFWCEFLASHGYIVVSPDHTGNARYTFIDGKMVRGDSKERAKSAEDRPKDMSYLLDEMIRWDKSDKRFKGRIDATHVAATGMSFGSYSSIQAADADPRFLAVVAMAAAPATHTNLTVPSLYFIGSKDKTIGPVGNAIVKNNFQAHTGPAMLIELLNGGHYSFTDVAKVIKNFGDGVGEGFTPRDTTYEIINSYSLAFLDVYLRGQKSQLKYLESNPWPTEIEIKRKGLGE